MPAAVTMGWLGAWGEKVYGPKRLTLNNLAGSTARSDRWTRTVR